MSLGELRDDRVRLLAENGYVYALGYTQSLARARVLRASRSDGVLETIAEHTGLGEPSDPTLHDGAVYYTRAGALIRLGPARSQMATLHPAADSPLAIQGDRAFFVDCDRPGTADRVIELPLAGGEPRVLAELSHPPGKRCQYSSVAADAREVLVADWNQQRIVAIARDSGATRDLVRRRGFVQELMLEAGAVSFLSNRGLERTDRNGANAKLLLDSERVVAPFSKAMLQSGSYWLVDDIAYTVVTHLLRLAYDGGAPETIARFEAGDPISSKPGDEWLLGYAADEQCIYFGHQRYARPLELFAKAF